jgi:hypothetical protein
VSSAGILRRTLSVSARNRNDHNGYRVSGRDRSFGTIRIGRGVRPLSAFVLVLGYSRAIHAVFTLDQTLESFLRGPWSTTI